MRTYVLNLFMGAISAAVFAASATEAQSNKIADEDLLNLLEAVNEVDTASVTQEVVEAVSTGGVSVVVEPLVVAVETEPEDEVVDPLSRVLESVQEEEQLAVEEDAEVEETAVVDDTPVQENKVDDLGMESYDEDTATTLGTLISVRLNKVGLEEAINLFAQLSGANIIVPELTEAAQISVNLKDVEWRPALQSILDSYNYELYQRVSRSNVYSVRRRPAGAPEPQVVETFKLNYATVPNAAKLIAELLPADAKVSEFASRNMIVVKSTESSLSEVRAVLDTIDTVRQQVYIESKFMELSDGAQKDLGIDWQVLQSYSAGTVGSSKYDVSQEKSTERKSNRLSDLTGVPYQEGSSFVETAAPATTSAVLEGLTPTVGTVKGDTTKELLTSVLSADQFRLMLSALQANRGVNIVSNPKIIVANEELANISIVTKEPNLKQERQQTAGATGGASIDNIVFSLDPQQPFFEYGVKLDVIPSINTSSNITVKINPALTRKEEDKVAGDNTYPVISEKSIETVFNLTSGQTAAIGGLTEVTESDIERKVPLLGSIPLLGRFFSWEQTISGQNETIIFVTVGLANTQMIKTETGLPEDSELARRRVIIERNKKVLRSQGRSYFEAQDAEKLDDTLKAMQQQENNRLERRNLALQIEAEKAAEKAAKKAAKEAGNQEEIASLN